MRVLNERFANANIDLLDGIKVFDEKGNRLADIKSGNGDFCGYVFSFSEGKRCCTQTVARVKDGPLATSQNARAPQSPGWPKNDAASGCSLPKPREPTIGFSLPLPSAPSSRTTAPCGSSRWSTASASACSPAARSSKSPGKTARA